MQGMVAPGVHRNPFNSAPVRVFTLLILFTAAAVHEAVHLSSLADGDIWWHLRTGLWILQSHVVPHNGLFSQYSNLPWVAYSWCYDVMIAAAYKAMGLRAVPIILMASEVVLSVVVFLLARGSRRNFWPAVSLAAIAQCALPGLQPRPVLCSIVLFAIELALLFQSRCTGDARLLLWMPLVFVLWANLHVQFVYGLLVLCLFFVTVLAEEIGRRSGVPWFEGRTPALPLTIILAVTAASLVATLLSPYSYHLYEAVAKNASSMVYSLEAHAMSFRQPQHYLLMLLTMAAFLSLGRRRSHDLFQITLMIVCSAASFRMQGDTWVVALSSVAVIADGLFIDALGAGPASDMRLRKWEKLVTAGLVVVVLVVAVISRIPLKSETLLNKVGETLPVRACDYIRQNRLPNPLFNEYKWGGFLTWYLPDYSVAIDGRTDLYGDDIIIRYFKVTNADVPLNSDPTFGRAQTILLEQSSAMAEALSAMSDFKVVYKDKLATVLVRLE